MSSEKKRNKQKIIDSCFFGCCHCCCCRRRRCCCLCFNVVVYVILCVWMVFFSLHLSITVFCFASFLLSLCIGFVPFQLFSSSSHILLFKCVLIYRSGTNNYNKNRCRHSWLAAVRCVFVDTTRSERKDRNIRNAFIRRVN